MTRNTLFCFPLFGVSNVKHSYNKQASSAPGCPWGHFPRRYSTTATLQFTHNIKEPSQQLIHTFYLFIFQEN